jgi:hypothetical protein
LIIDPRPSTLLGAKSTTALIGDFLGLKIESVLELYQALMHTIILTMATMPRTPAQSQYMIHIPATMIRTPLANLAVGVCRYDPTRGRIYRMGTLGTCPGSMPLLTVTPASFLGDACGWNGKN